MKLSSVITAGLGICLLIGLAGNVEARSWDTQSKPPHFWMSVWGGRGWATSEGDRDPFTSNFDVGGRLEIGHPHRVGISWEVQRFTERRQDFLNGDGNPITLQPQVSLRILAITYGFVPTFNNGLTLHFRTGPALVKRIDSAGDSADDTTYPEHSDTRFGYLTQVGAGYHLSTRITFSGILQYHYARPKILADLRRNRNWSRQSLLLLGHLTVGF